MTGEWGWVEAAAQLLALDEREAVLGDLAEAHEGSWQALRAVLGLALRKQIELWRSWRPWVAAFLVALPCSFLLEGASLSVSWAFRDILSSFALENSRASSASALGLLIQTLLLTGWSWTSGFLVGSMSRRTLWVSATSCLLPCLYCLARFRVEGLSGFCLLLFLLPAVVGGRNGMRMGRMERNTAVVMAATVTTLATSTLHANGQPWWDPPQWLNLLTLSWPAWYLVAAARMPSKQTKSINR